MLGPVLGVADETNDGDIDGDELGPVDEFKVCIIVGVKVGPETLLK